MSVAFARSTFSRITTFQLDISTESPQSRPTLHQKFYLNVIFKWNQIYPERKELMMVLQDLLVLNALIAVGMPAIFEDPFFLGMKINPIIIRLRPSLQQKKEPGEIIETACRLAALIYLSDIRIEFVLYHVTGYHFVERLRETALAETTEWEEFQDLRLWVLVIGAIKALPEDQLLFIDGIKRVLERLHIATWDDATLVVESILFNEEIYGPRCRNLGRDVMGSS